MHRKAKAFILLFAVVTLIVVTLFACKPVETPVRDDFPIINDENNQKYLDPRTYDPNDRSKVIDRAVGSMENLLAHLDTDEVSDSGYYVGADMTVNTENGSAFALRMQANLYTYPYELKDKEGKVICDERGVPIADPEKLKIHNEKIKYSDIVLEWFDGATNEMLIGFYFDGINPNSPDPGNNLYLNLQGSKRIFPNFGDSVLYQQFIRLITKFNLETVIGAASSDGKAGTSLNALRDALDLAVTDNYKRTINGEETTIFFENLNLTTLTPTVTEYMQSIFKPFEDKLDPLTNKYLGFLFSTLGVTSFKTMMSDMEYIMEYNENLNKEILNQLVMDVSGDSAVPRKNEQTGITIQETVPYKAHISAEYSTRTATNIVIDKANYKLYEYGSYEYVGDMYIPLLDLQLDVLLRTDINEVDNSTNKVFMNCRDLATDDLLIGGYYKHETVNRNDGSTDEGEFTFIDVAGLQHLYGGVKLEDIGLPRAYRGGFDLADTLAWLFDFIDEYLVIAVDNILYGDISSEEESQYEKLTSIIMANVTSTMKNEDDPSSRATIKIKVDVELIRQILSATSETGTEYTTEQMIMLINRQFNIDLQSIASILGLSIEELIDKTFFELTYDVDSFGIKLEIYSFAEMTKEEIEALGGAQLILRLDLLPTHIGEFVKIVFPNFSKFKELEDVMTYSGELDGEFTFASTEDVFLGDLLGSFMGDVRKTSNPKDVISDRNRKVPYNTPYTLPKEAVIQFTLVYDQYIREQVLENGRWTRTSRSAFRLAFYVVQANNEEPQNIVNVYANDVSFNTADPVEELGYVWLDFACVEGLPKFKVREDVFVKSFYRYMGYDFEEDGDSIVLGLTDIVKALMKDSWAVFEPEVIRITTSNETVKNFFNVDEMIATASARIGFKQRVRGIDELENDFAMYTIDDFSDIYGDSPYEIKLHETAKVYFDFGSRAETRDLYFLYSDDSVKVINGEATYRPTMRNQFMGVVRDYLVVIETDIGRQAINELRDKRQDWEPLDPIPERVSALYGEDNLTSDYAAKYILHASYDPASGYYVVHNNMGYEIIYDVANNIYVVGLGTTRKYDEDKLSAILNPSVPYYRREIKSKAGSSDDGLEYAQVDCVYDLGMRVKGWYVAKHESYNVLYSPDRNVFVVETDEALEKLREENYFKSGDVVYVRTLRAVGGQTFIYDLESGLYCSMITVDAEGTEQLVLYSRAQNYFYVPDRDTYSIVQPVLRESRMTVNANLDWEKEYDLTGRRYSEVDYNNTMWSSFTWKDMSWEDVTLEGGMFVVKVIIGDGMMATYSENIVVKIINRTIDTDVYVNIETPEGTVKAPVAYNVQVDPYVYLVYKAYYENVYADKLNPDEKIGGFVTWFFKKYTATFKFTVIYHNEEDTPDEVGSFAWQFDYDSEKGAIYKEKQINNRHFTDEYGKTESMNTYVYTVFHGQVIALGVEVLPRMLDSVYSRGETENNVYTVDALEPDTYTISDDLVFVFRDGRGAKFAFDPKDYSKGYGESIPSIFACFPADFESELPGYDVEGADALAIIKWANPVADNVRLTNSVTLPDGTTTVYPFRSKINIDDGTHNYTKAFFDLANNYDFRGKWYYEDWFKTEEIVIRVDMPDKTIGERDYEYKAGVAHNPETAVVMNIQVEPYYTEGQTEVGEDWGVYLVDPYDSKTWVLPSRVYVHFDGRTGEYTPYAYDVAWRNAEGDTRVHFDDATGKYVLTDVSEVPGGYFLYATIGEGENTLDIRIFVHNLSAYMASITFLGEDGELVSDKYNETADVVGSLTSAPVERYEYQLATYTYYVDTYSRFDIPSSVTILFNDGTTRSYPVDWDKNHAPWAQGTNVEINATIGDAYALRHVVYLTVRLESKILEELVIAHADEAIDAIYTATGVEPTITVSIIDNTVSVKGILLTSEGMVDLGKLGKMTPYDFFDWLFADITAKFIGKPAVRITDAVDSARLPIFAGFDTQKLIKEYVGAYGQGVDIYVGQDDDAHDFTVITELLGNAHVEYEDGQSAIVAIVDIEPYNADNTPKYPNGFVIAEQIGFTVTRKDGTRVYYSNNNGRPLPELWAVACPTQEIGNEYWADENEYNRMAEVTPDEQLTTISWERLLLGGEIWLTAMLEDSSRVYVKVVCTSQAIGENYHSADDDESPYKISYGMITIDNLYDNYKLSSFITPGSLPSKIKIGDPSSDLVKTNIIWKLNEGARDILESIDYEGTVGKYEDDRVEIARASIIGKEVKLYLKVLPCKVKALRYDLVEDRDFVTEDLDPDSQTITLHIDAYKNWAYAGKFILPSNLKLVYDETGREGSASNEYLYTAITYYCLDTNAEIKEIGYDLNGHTIAEIADKRNIYAAIWLKDGQDIRLKIHIDDKHVESVSAGAYNNSKFYIDPYSEEITVPQTVVVNFTEGDPLTYTTQWAQDPEFEVKYDTYRRILGERAEPYFLFTSTLTGYSGVVDQPLLLKVQVYDKLVDDYELVAGFEDSYANYDNPNAYFRYEDPFAGKASDLPSDFEVRGLGYDIIWEFADEDIKVPGTYSTVVKPDGTRDYAVVPVTVIGHVYNAERGQPVAINVYVDKWQFLQIRKPDGKGGYIIMEGDALRFIISSITGVSAETNYQVDFTKTYIDIDSEELYESRVQKIFIPEGVSPNVVDDSYDDSYPYRLYWDDEALNRAKSNEEATGYFAFGDENGLEKEQHTPARYQYERPNILSVDFGYGYGTEQNAVYVVNPINPVFEDMEVLATGTYSGNYNVSLNDAGLTITATWNSGKPEVSSYFAGGVIRNQPVTLEMTKADDDSFYYAQSFNIMLVMLDMSPTSYIGNPSISVLNGARFKTTYNASTYAGSSNPYKDVYVDYLIGKSVDRDGTVRNVLDTAISDYGLGERTLTYIVTEWEDRVYNSNNTKTQRSVKVRVNGRDYRTNSVMRRWNSMFAITGLKLGYGSADFGIDSADYDKKEQDGTLSATDKKIVKVVNPVDPVFGTRYSVTSSRYETVLLADAVRGTYNGSDITGYGYTFSITWWDVETDGNTVEFGNVGMSGGIIDYWKAKVRVYDGTTVVYEQVINVQLVLMDMTPENNVLYSEDESKVFGRGVINYKADTYDGKVNPYGEEYSRLVNALNTGVIETGLASITYEYTVVEWGEYETVVIEGEEREVRTSKVVEIKFADGSKKLVRTDAFTTIL